MSKTTKKERIIAGLVAGFMLLSTVGGYIAMVLGTKNKQPVSKGEKAAQQRALDDYMKKIQKYSEYMQGIAAKMSQKYYKTFSAYQNSGKKFENGSIKKLVIKDIKKGTGAEIKKGVAYRAYYIGWKSDGKVFDSSFDTDKKSLKSPLEGGEGLIEGWKKGVEGMKIGGVREIHIPAKQAYGDKKTGDIPANSDLKFIIMAVEPMTKQEKDNIPRVK